jgi:hypothetical protein
MHPIKRAILVVLLSLGAIGGFTHGFAHMAQCHSSCGMSRREQFEQHVADVCTRSAERVHEHGVPPAPPPSQGTVLAAPPGFAWALVPVAAPAPVAVAAPVALTAPIADAEPATE